MKHHGLRLLALLLTLTVSSTLTACSSTDQPVDSTETFESKGEVSQNHQTALPVTIHLLDAEGQPLGGVVATIRTADKSVKCTSLSSGQCPLGTLTIQQFVPVTISEEDGNTVLAQTCLFLDFGGPVCYYSNSSEYVYCYLTEDMAELTVDLQIGEDGTMAAVGIR